MSAWTSAPLGSVTRVVSGTTPRTDDSAAWNGDVVWVTPADLGQLRSGRIEDSARRITAAAVREYGLESVPPGSVVMSSRAPIGHLAIADVRAVTNQGCKSFVPGPSMNGEFLYWLLRYRMGDIRALGSGATFAEVSKSTLERLPISFPPLDEQRRIAARLADAMGETRAARDAVEARRLELEGLRRSVISAAFRTASRPVATALGSIGRLVDGDWILNADYAPSGVRLLQVGDVGRGRLSIKSNRHITEDRATELKCTLLKPGDVLISRMPEPLGRACVLPDLGYPCITAVDVTIMRIDPGRADLDYLTGYLNSQEWYAAVAAKSSGATRPRISRKNLELLPVPLPSLPVQRRIAVRLRAQFAEIDHAKAALDAQRAAIDALPAALLREVFGLSPVGD